MVLMEIPPHPRAEDRQGHHLNLQVGGAALRIHEEVGLKQLKYPIFFQFWCLVINMKVWEEA